MHHLALLVAQNLLTLTPPPEPVDWSAVSINTDLYLGTIRASVSNLVDKFQEELKRMYGKGEHSQSIFVTLLMFVLQIYYVVSSP